MQEFLDSIDFDNPNCIDTLMNVSEKLDNFIEEKLNVARELEINIIKKRRELERQKTSDFLNNQDYQEPEKSCKITENVAHLLLQLSQKVLIFGDFDITRDFFEVPVDQSKNCINFLVDQGGMPIKHQATFNSYWEICGIKNLENGVILDTMGVWNQIKDIDDKIREDKTGLKYNITFVNLLKDYHKKNLTSKNRNNTYIEHEIQS